MIVAEEETTLIQDLLIEKRRNILEKMAIEKEEVLQKNEKEIKKKLKH